MDEYFDLLILFSYPIFSPILMFISPRRVTDLNFPRINIQNQHPTRLIWQLDLRAKHLNELTLNEISKHTVCSASLEVLAVNQYRKSKDEQMGAWAPVNASQLPEENTPKHQTPRAMSSILLLLKVMSSILLHISIMK